MKKFLSARAAASPLIGVFSAGVVLFLAGAATPARAVDFCAEACNLKGQSASLICFQLTTALGVQGCETNKTTEPCASLWKQFTFICGPFNPSQSYSFPQPQWAGAPFCSPQWMNLCHEAGGISKPKKSKPKKTKPKKIKLPKPAPKGALSCPANMTLGALGTCVPKLDMPGFDTSPGSTPGAGRAAPAGPSGGGVPVGRR